MTNLDCVSTVSLRALAAAGLLGAMTAPGHALTAQELWDQWQTYIGSFGYEVSADTDVTGEDVRLSDLTLTVPLAEDGDEAGTMTITLGEVTLSGQDDGTVDITMPASVPLVIDARPEDEDDVLVELDQTNTGLSVTASGTPDAIAYDFAADSVGVSLARLERDGEQIDLGTMRMDMTDLSGTSSYNRGDGIVVDQDLSVGEVTYEVDITNPDPGGEGTFKMSGMLSGLTSTGGGTIPADIDLNDMPAALAAGYAVNATIGFESGRSEMAFREGDDWFETESSSSGGGFEVALDSERLLYDISSRQIAFKAAGAEIPFPIDISAERLGVMLTAPIAASDGPQNFAASITLTDVALPESVWAMGDPQGMLPHEPLTVEIALNGTGQLFVNLLDEEEMEKLTQTGGVPGTVESVNVEQVRIKGAGAEITASADIEVDNSAMSPLGPMPNTFGTADLRVQGVKTLLQTLSQMGLVPSGQAMMVSGMISELGKEESGPDDLSADIELTEEGMLTVNGQPMQMQ